MAKFMARPVADHISEFDWKPIVRTDEGLARWVSIYKKREPDDLTESEEIELRAMLSAAKYEIKEVRS